MSQPAAIAEFFDRERTSEVAVLLGKGPSIDGYTDRPERVAYVMGVNEVACAHACDGVVWGDSILQTTPFPEHTEIFRPCGSQSHGGRGYAFKRDRGDGDGFEIPMIGRGVSSRAMTILAMWGCRTIHLWGFDCLHREAVSYDECYGETVKPHIMPGGAKMFKYPGRAAGLREVRDHYQLEWIDHGESWVATPATPT